MRQFGALIEIADRNQKAMNDLDRRLQAYLNTLLRQQRTSSGFISGSLS